MADKHIIVYCARHGTTELNAAGCFRGHRNVALDASGIRDAHKLAFYFDGIEVSHIVASDKLRAQQTADIIAQRKNLPVRTTETLRPWHVGDFSGQPKDDATMKRLDYYIENPDVQIPNGESLNEFKQRIRPALAGAAELAEQSGAPVLLVMHSSDIHEVGSMLYGNHEATLVEPGGVVALYVSNGELHAEPIFKPRLNNSHRADAVS